MTEYHVCVCVCVCARVRLYLLTLAVEVYEGVAGCWEVLGRHPLVHPVDVEVQPPRPVHQQPQHRALRTRVQVRPVVLTDLTDGRTDGGQVIHWSLPGVCVCV